MPLQELLRWLHAEHPTTVASATVTVAASQSVLTEMPQDAGPIHVSCILQRLLNRVALQAPFNSARTWSHEENDGALVVPHGGNIARHLFS